MPRFSRECGDEVIRETHPLPSAAFPAEAALMRIGLIGCALMVSAVSFAAAPRIVIHGGAGATPSSSLKTAEERAIRADLEQALRRGQTILDGGGSALDAVETAVRFLEDSPRFNAGRGAVFNANGEIELDAAIMDGSTLKAGAVAGIHRVRNPIGLARSVMERSAHVMMIGGGAEQFAESIGIKLIDPKWFHTEMRWQQHLEAKAAAERTSLIQVQAMPSHRVGTVGAVALDARGHLAAATSTGGMAMKRFGRVGDVPVIGAGTYADARCAVSATGWGEFYIRATAARDICARVEFGNATIDAAAKAVVLEKIPALGGNGGVIALDANGAFSMPFNTQAMYRGWIDADGNIQTAIDP
jgi:L-asparaginase / beta-aspartyl-peptidase